MDKINWIWENSKYKLGKVELQKKLSMDKVTAARAQPTEACPLSALARAACGCLG